jgi:hypothetical protein
MRVAVTLIALSWTVAYPMSARADTTVDFEAFPPGTVLTNQYADLGGPGQGVVFGPLPGGAGDGLRPVVRTAPTGQAQSGTQIADIATCTGCEFFTPSTTGTFGTLRSMVSVDVGYLGDPAPCAAGNPDAIGCAVVKLQAFDGNGTLVGEASALVTQGAGIHTQLSVTTPSTVIVGFRIGARSGTDASKTIAIDDLAFGVPSAPQPDFTLNPAATTLTVEQGASATDTVTIGRLGGSTGDVTLSADGLPAGADITFAPNPASGSQTVLTLAADTNATVTDGTPVTITGTPQAPTVGPASRSFTLNVLVQPACPQVGTAQELIDKLVAGFKCIFVRDDADIDLSAVPDNPLRDDESILVIPEGVTLKSDRSPTKLGGILEMSHRMPPPDPSDPDTYQKIMLNLGSNDRVTGLRLRGYNETDRRNHDDRTRAIAIEGSTGVLVDNNEIFGWPHSGVYVTLAPTDRSMTARITRNFIHNNLQCSEGQGVQIGGGGFARIDHNLFNSNRHDVGSIGGPGQGYDAEYNFSLIGGPKCNPGDVFPYYNQHYDMHGENDGYGGTAGTFMEILHNTIRGAQSYHGGYHTRPAFWLRGTPEDKAIFAFNVVHSGDKLGNTGAVRVTGDADQMIDDHRLVIRNNRLCTDTASALAVGDFNGDGRDDVFQSVGTLWVYSPFGQRDWQVLHDSALRLDRLGLGDFDGDGKTDVFYQVGDRWMVSSGGTGPPTELPVGSNIDIRGYRFFDFDGDGRTDVFRANGSQWFYSSAGTTEWQPLATSHFKVDRLRFGDFDGDGTTDAFSLANGQWSVSFGGNTDWTKLNRRLSSDLEDLVFADFNGDGKTDVAQTDDGNWRVSWGGTTPWRILQYRRPEPLSIGMLFGDFNGDGRDDVLEHGVVTQATTTCWAYDSDTTLFDSLDRYLMSDGGAHPFGIWSYANIR